MFIGKTLRCWRPFGMGFGLAALLLAVGCGGGAGGPDLAFVTGVVLLDGQPLPDAIVVFQPTGPQGSPSNAVTTADGRFELSFNRNRKGAIPGDHRVKISTARLISNENGDETEVPEKLPPRYHEKTELSYAVKPGKNEFEIQLDSKGAPKGRGASHPVVRR